MDIDIEKESTDVVKINYLKGYPSLAAFIASDKDKSTLIFRRFDRLSARNLLHLQSELVELQARQDAFDGADFRGSRENKGIVSDWELLSSRGSDAKNTREWERMRLAKQIRETLKDYREAILLESTLVSIQPPSSRALTAFRNVFYNVDSPGGSFPTLGGRGASIYDEKEKNDLMSLRKPSEEDRLTSFIRYSCPWLFIKRNKSQTNTPLAYFSERRLQIFVGIINILLAFALLFGAIIHLYSVTSPRTKLGLVAFYAVSFALCVGLVTNARRSEVFGACAAYAAVLVVFVSGNFGGGDGGSGGAT